MSVQSVSAAESAKASWWIEALKKKEAEQKQGIVSMGELSPPATMDVSPMAQMLSKLDSLSKSDPDKFKEVTAQIAAKLEEAAKSATGRDAEFLSQMARQFSAASEAGDVAALEPPDSATHQGYGQSGDTPPPPPDGALAGGPSEAIRSVMDGIFATIADL
jgi:hypothetical protein